MTDVPAGVAEYAKRVGKRFPDRPAAERATIVADLADHLNESGLRMYESCVAAHGKPVTYATELRESMALGPVPRAWRRWRTSPAMIVGLVVGVIAVAAVTTMVVHQVRKLPKEFNPLRAGSSMSSPPGAVDVVGAGFRMTIDDTPVPAARVAFVVTNDSDHDLDVTSIALPTVLFDDQGMSVLVVGEPLVDLRPGTVSSQDLWDADLRLFDLDEPNFFDVGDHFAPDGRTFSPFTLKAGQAVLLSIQGDRATCPEMVGAMLGGGSSINFAFSTNGQSFDVPVLAYSFDLSSCQT